jgi:hypothetical protein
MRCVPESVNGLFPELDLSRFVARPAGYELGDIQRMLSNDLTVWPIYVNHAPCMNFDLVKVLPNTENLIPLFLFTKKHCMLSYWNKTEIEVPELNATFDSNSFFMRNKILKVAGVARYEDYSLLTVRP